MKRLAIALILTAGPVVADPAMIEAVEARGGGSGWTFSVTLSHGDTGWDDYADGWRIEAPDGTVLGTRTLVHPHENEQPFTRSQSGIAIPPGMTTVRIRASTTVEGWAGSTRSFDLPDPE